MVAKINRGASLYGAVIYNQQKVDDSTARIISGNRMIADVTGNPEQVMRNTLWAFENYLLANKNTEKPILHISLNPSVDDKLTDSQFADLAREYMQRMGYGDQPYIVYIHEDIDRRHIHIVSTCVNEKGEKIDDAYEWNRSMKACRELERKFGLKQVEDKRREMLEPYLKKADYQNGDVKQQVSNILKSVFSTYRFQSFGEYSALLSCFNIEAKQVRGEFEGTPYNGIVYTMTDDTGKPVCTPIMEHDEVLGLVVLFLIGAIAYFQLVFHALFYFQIAGILKVEVVGEVVLVQLFLVRKGDLDVVVFVIVFVQIVLHIVGQFLAAQIVVVHQFFQIVLEDGCHQILGIAILDGFVIVLDHALGAAAEKGAEQDNHQNGCDHDTACRNEQSLGVHAQERLFAARNGSHCICAHAVRLLGLLGCFVFRAAVRAEFVLRIQFRSAVFAKCHVFSLSLSFVVFHHLPQFCEGGILALFRQDGQQFCQLPLGLRMEHPTLFGGGTLEIVQGTVLVVAVFQIDLAGSHPVTEHLCQKAHRHFHRLDPFGFRVIVLPVLEVVAVAPLVVHP